ncbi:hypothetical protein As57867_006100, partial [Aphanomyces stellatus]
MALGWVPCGCVSCVRRAPSLRIFVLRHLVNLTLPFASTIYTMKTTVVAAAALVALVSAATDPVVTCTNSVSSVIAAANTNDGAKACATESGLSPTAPDMSDAALKKFADAKACQAWWTATVGSINKIAPACDMMNVFDVAAPGTIVKTDKFNATMADYVANIKAMVAASTGGN